MPRGARSSRAATWRCELARASAPCHVAQVHEKESGEVDILTKGDNNAVDDRGLYAASQSWINKEHVIGRAKGYLPYIGMVTIIMNDYPVRPPPPSSRDDKNTLSSGDGRDLVSLCPMLGVV